MDRRGQNGLRLIIGIVLALLVLAIVIMFQKKVGGSFNDFITCDPADNQYTCEFVSDGCGTGTRVPWKVDGCPKISGKTRLCCILPGTGGGGGPDGPGEGPPPLKPPKLLVYKVTLKADNKLDDLDPISSGSTFPIIVEQEASILVKVEGCEPICSELELKISMKNMVGEELSPIIKLYKIENDEWGVDEDSVISDKERYTFPDPSKVLTQESEYKQAFLFKFPSVLLNEKIHFEVEMKYEVANQTQEDAEETNPDRDDGEEAEYNTKSIKSERIFNMYFDVKPGVRIGGLTSRWEKSKVITAVCDNPLKCQNIFYKIVPGEPIPGCTEGKCIGAPATCDNPKPEEIPNILSTQTVTEFCIMTEKGDYLECFPTNAECVSEGYPKYMPQDLKQSSEILKQGLKNNLVPEDAAEWLKKNEELLNTLNKGENVKSMYSCVEGHSSWIGKGPTTVEPTKDKTDWFAAERPSSGVERWRFTLDKPYMTAQYLCVVGQSVTAGLPGGNPKKSFYSIGKPQKIFIDRIPPSVYIKFNPALLRITLACDDDHSGCEPYMGTSHLSSLTKFFPSLFSGGPERAAEVCPPYESGSGYRTEMRSVIPYVGDTLSILCARGEDRAGNAAVSMATVYNSYDVLGAALIKFVHDEEGVQVR